MNNINILQIAASSVLGAITGLCVSNINGVLEKAMIDRRHEDNPDLVYKNPDKKENTLKSLLLAITGLGTALVFKDCTHLVFAFVTLLILSTIFITDTKYYLIPNPLVKALIFTKLFFSIPALFGAPGFLPYTTKELMWSAITAVAVAVLLILPCILIVPGAIAPGDIKLMAGIGFVFGPSFTLLCLIGMGLLIFLYKIVFKVLVRIIRDKAPIAVVFGELRSYGRDKAALGPYIAMSAYMLLLYSGISAIPEIIKI